MRLKDYSCEILTENIKKMLSASLLPLNTKKLDSEDLEDYLNNLVKVLSLVENDEAKIDYLKFVLIVYNTISDIKNYFIESKEEALREIWEILVDYALEIRNGYSRFYASYLVTSKILSLIDGVNPNSGNKIIISKRELNNLIRKSQNLETNSSLELITFSSDFIKKIYELKENEESLAIILENIYTPGFTDTALTDRKKILDDIDYQKRQKISYAYDVSSLYYTDTSYKQKTETDGLRNIRNVEEVKKISSSNVVYFDDEDLFYYMLSRNEFMTFSYREEVVDKLELHINIIIPEDFKQYEEYFSIVNYLFRRNSEDSNINIFSATYSKKIATILLYNIITFILSDKYLIKNKVQFTLIKKSGEHVTFDLHKDFYDSPVDYEFVMNKIVSKNSSFFYNTYFERKSTYYSFVSKENSFEKHSKNNQSINILINTTEDRLKNTLIIRYKTEKTFQIKVNKKELVVSNLEDVFSTVQNWLSKVIYEKLG